MEKQQKKRIKKYISWGLAVVLVALLAVMPLIAGNTEAVDGPQASILSGTVERNNIATQLMGGGTLTGEAALEIEIPAAVKLTGFLVDNGDTVEEGDIIATVDRITVMTAITQVQETMDYLAEEIDAVSDDEAASEVAAQAGGTVKILYAQVGERVQDVMLEHGALAVLSLDGMMAVQIECSTDLSGGDKVYVTLSDGTEADGRVESNLEGILTITIADDDFPVGEKVTVQSEDGDRIGSGELYIHSQWNAVAYSGTVSSVKVNEGDTVSAGKPLISLKDAGHTALYQQMVNQHREYEALMLDLFRMYQSETITAPCAGVVSGVDEDGAYMLSDSGSDWVVTLLANAPNGNDESAYVNYIGQVTSVGIDGLVMKMNPKQQSVTDYKDLSEVDTDTALMTEDVIYSAQAPVYELTEGEWVQIEASAITQGDILLFAGDAEGNFVWVVRVAQSEEKPETPEETQPAEPEIPSEPETPSVPETPEKPSGSENDMSHMIPGGSFSGFGGMIQDEEEFQLYALDTVTVASVTSQNEMTVEIAIDELDISKIYTGQEADVTVAALTGQTFSAVVTRIGNTGETDGGNSKFTVELTLEKSSDMLPGMSASVIITLDTLTDVVSVPVAALEENGGKTVIYTSYDEDSGELGDPVAVEVGVSDGENAQILSGIDEGAAYYYAYYDTLVISNAPAGRSFFGR